MFANGSSQGRQYGDYRITELLGSGGMGTVYRAWDENLKRDVALKVMDRRRIADPREIERFQREARLVARLDHPNIVSVFDTGEEDGLLYLAMELVEGDPLRSLIRSHQGGLPVEQAMTIAAQLLSAVEAAHDAGIVHRDIKPDNIILRADGTVKVLDFGVARMEGEMALTRPNEILGTVEYMAPEQILGEGIGPSVDLYASGVVCYEMLTGALPFSGDSPATLVYHQLNEEPRAPSLLTPTVSRPLDRLVLRLLNKLPEDRYSSAGKALAALEEATHRQALVSIPGLEETQKEQRAHELRTRDFQPRFIGRRTELETLATHFDALEAGGRVIFVSGEAGVGKSRLIGQLERHARNRQGRTTRGFCFFEHGMGPYMPFFDALGHLIDGLPEAERTSIRQTLRQQLPEFADTVATDAHGSTTARIRAGFLQAFGTEDRPEAARRRLFDALFDLLDALSKAHPLVICLEDVHWADDGSLELLRYLVRRASEAHFLCVATYRPEELGGDDGETGSLSGLLQQLHAEGLLHEVRLRRLRSEDVVQLARSLFLEADFSAEFGDFLFGQSQGNPLVAVETLKLLYDQGILNCTAGIWSVSPALSAPAVPERISALVMRRVNRLDLEQRELLQMAAVIGPRFTSAVLEAIAGTSRIELLKQLFRLERQNRLIASADGTYEFSHSKIREVLYSEIPWELRREYHRVVAPVLEAQRDHQRPIADAELGLHFFLGEEFARALPYLIRGGNEAFKLCSWRHAAALFEQAAEACRRSGAPVESLLHALRYGGVACFYLSAYEQAQERIAQMRETAAGAGRPEEEAEAWKIAGKIDEQQRNFTAALDSYQKGLARLQGHDAPEIRSGILLNMGCVDFECGRYDNAEVQWREALHLAENRTLRGTSEALNNLAVLATMRGHLDEAWSRYERVLELAEEDDPQTALTYYNMGMVRADQGRWDEALALYDRSLQSSRAHRYAAPESAIEVNRAEALINKGNLVEAREACGRALRGFRRQDDALGVADALRLYGRLCRLERNFKDSTTYLGKSIQLNREFGETVSLGEALYELGLLHQDEGRVRAAVASLREAEAIFAQIKAEPDLDRVRTLISALEAA